MQKHTVQKLNQYLKPNQSLTIRIRFFFKLKAIPNDDLDKQHMLLIWRTCADYRSRQALNICILFPTLKWTTAEWNR